MCKPVVTAAPPTVIVDLAPEPAVSNNATENATESVVDTQSFSVVEQVFVDNVPVNGSTMESVLEPLPATPTAVEASATVLEMQPQENFTTDTNTTMSNLTESQSVTEPSPISTTTGVLTLVDAVSTDTMGVTEPAINEIVTEASSNTTEAVNSTIPDPVPEIIFPSVVLPEDPVPLITDPPVLTTEPPTTTDLPGNAEPAATGGAPAVTELPTADQPAQPAVMDPLVDQGAGAAAAVDPQFLPIIVSTTPMDFGMPGLVAVDPIPTVTDALPAVEPTPAIDPVPSAAILPVDPLQEMGNSTMPAVGDVLAVDPVSDVNNTATQPSQAVENVTAAAVEQMVTTPIFELPTTQMPNLETANAAAVDTANTAVLDAGSNMAGTDGFLSLTVDAPAQPAVIEPAIVSATTAAASSATVAATAAPTAAPTVAPTAAPTAAPVYLTDPRCPWVKGKGSALIYALFVAIIHC